MDNINESLTKFKKLDDEKNIELNKVVDTLNSYADEMRRIIDRLSEVGIKAWEYDSCDYEPGTVRLGFSVSSNDDNVPGIVFDYTDYIDY